jgi:hypothetical protein
MVRRILNIAIVVGVGVFVARNFDGIENVPQSTAQQLHGGAWCWGYEVITFTTQCDRDGNGNWACSGWGANGTGTKWGGSEISYDECFANCSNGKGTVHGNCFWNE